MNKKLKFFIVGILGGFAYPPFNLYFPVFSVVCLSLFLSYMLYLIDVSKSAKTAFWRMFWLTEISYLISFSWIMKPFFFLPENLIIILLVAPIGLFLLTALLTLFIEFSGIITFKVSEGKRYFTFALSLTFFEWVRSWIFTGLPWNQFSLVWSGIPVFMQTLSLVGSFGLTFLTIFVLSFPYLIYKKSWKSKTGFFVIIIFVFMLIFGLVRINKYQESKYSDFKVRLIDPQVPQYLINNKNMVDKYINLAHRDGWKDVDLFVFSETSSPFDLTNNGYYEMLYSNINNEKSSLIVGFNRYDNFDEFGQNYDVYNSLAILDKNGIKHVYDKHHLVPFGEYIPFKKLLPFKKFTEGTKDFSEGSEKKSINYFSLKLLPLICYEIIFSELSVPEDVDVIVNISNDAWFGDLGKSQHLEIAKFRAVEEGVPIIRVANFGYKDLGPSVISALGYIENGKIVVGKDDMTGIVKDFVLPLRIERTLFSKTGNLLFLIFCFCGFFFVFNFYQLFDFTKKNK